jgi:RNA polymerase sigma-70 factor (ECF subfamily)
MPRESAKIAAETRLGAADVFARAYDDHVGSVYSAAFAILRDTARAQDITHDVFLSLWRDPESFDASRSELSTFLRLRARSQALDAWRRRQSAARARDRLQALGGEVAERADDSPAHVSERAEERARLRAALRSLPVPQRETIVLAYWGGLTVEEVARRVDVPLGTAKSRMRLGLARLRTQLADEDETASAPAA